MGKKDYEPALAENGLERTKRMLVQMHCIAGEKFQCETSLLQDEAYQWWVSVTRTAPPERVTWRFFLDEFKKHSVRRIYLNNMRREFHNLKQRQLSVTEYLTEFTRLSKYAPKMLVSEEEKCRKFEDGLSDHIRAHVIGFFNEYFSKITTCALNVERVKKEENERKIPASQVLINNRVRDSRDHEIPGSLQLRPPVEILLCQRRQLQVHKEVPPYDKMFLVVPIVEENTREIVGD